MTLSAEDEHRLEQFWQFCRTHQYFNVGYPEAADFDYSALHRFLYFSINNCGDWAVPGNYVLNSFEFEREVMHFFAELFSIPAPHSWGYVTNGGTEGNMFGCYLARELFPEGTLYYSQETHYSVMKIIKLLRIKAKKIATQPNGELDYDQLATQILCDGERHPIIFANIGTTLKGAIDNIALIKQRLSAIGIARQDYYLHADAALSGMILPFVDNAPAFSFADDIDSISVSGHKMIGSPIPCGIVLAKRHLVDRIAVEVDYILASDQTISGSRNGFTPLVMWAAIKGRTLAQWRERTRRCLAMAQQVVERLNHQGVPAWRHPHSITVVFPRPSERTWKTHCLATSGEHSHLIILPHHHSLHQLNAVIRDIVRDLGPAAACNASQPPVLACSA
jgi:histidine decarboxylase